MIQIFKYPSLKRNFSYTAKLSVNQENENRLNELHRRLDESCTRRGANLSSLVECNSKIDGIQNKMTEDLNPYIREELSYANNKAMDKICDFNAKISELDISKINTELDEINLEKQKLQSRLDHTEFVKDVLNNHNISVPQNLRERYSDLQESKSELIAKDRRLTEEHITNITEYIRTIEQADNSGSASTTEQVSSETNRNNGGSLIDDYADPNTEQPSHMDPDD